MNRKLIILSTLLAGVASSGVLTSCKDNDEDLRAEVLSIINSGYNRDSLQADLNALRQELLGYVPSLEIKDDYWWINGQNTGVKAKGEDGQNGTNGIDGNTPYIQDGYWYINGVNTGVMAQGPQGEQGNPGANGYTPYIQDGYWYINGESTGVKATGENGNDGSTPYIQDGYWYINGASTGVKATGEDGKPGSTPYIQGGYWYIDGVSTGVKAEGTDGSTPVIGEDGYWYVNGQNTGVKALGEDGKPGSTPYIQDDYWYIDGVNTGIKAKGEDGADGINGITPSIGEDGYWYIGDENTGVRATADVVTIEKVDGVWYWFINGENTGIQAEGKNGQDGQDGQDGKTPYIGENGNWWIDGVDTGVKAEGKDGQDGTTPRIGDNGNWWIGNTDTGIPAKGQDGEDGISTEITISEDGYWVINGEKTPFKVSGKDGEDGEDGQDGDTWTIGADGYWYLNGVKTEYKAIGKDGQDGQDGEDGEDGDKIEIAQDPTIGDGVYYWFINGVNTGFPVTTGCGCDIEFYKKCIAFSYKVSYRLAEALHNNNVTYDELATWGAQIKELRSELDLLKKKIREAMETHVTGVIIQGAKNPAFGYINTPLGINSTVLMAYYGNIASAVEFPMDAFDNAGFDYSLVSGMPNESLSGDVVTDDGEPGNAGVLYLTVNPSSYNFTGKLTPVLVNSLGEECPMTLSTITGSDEKLTFGYTRAGAAPALYQSAATISAADAASIAPRIDLNKSEVKEALEDIITPRDGIDWTRITSVVYNAINDVLDAEAVKVISYDGIIHTSTTSNYAVAATAVKALGYEWSNNIDDFVDKAYDKLFNEVIDIVNRIVEKVQDKVVEKYGTTLTSLTINQVVQSSADEVIVTCVDGDGNTVDVTIKVGDISDYIDDINDYIAKINDLYGDMTGSTVTEKIQEALNEIKSSLKSHTSIGAKLQPAMFRVVDGQISVLSNAKMYPSKISANAKLLASSFTYDMVVPAYKKYVAVTNVYNMDGSVASNAASLAASANTGSFNQIFDGSKRTVTAAGLQSNYIYELGYAAVDYTGNTRVTVFYVTVE